MKPDKDTVTIWTITHRPIDMPGTEYAARAHYCTRNSVSVDPGPPLTAKTLEEIRAALPPGLHNLGREKNDDPVIVESWI